MQHIWNSWHFFPLDEYFGMASRVGWSSFHLFESTIHAATSLQSSLVLEGIILVRTVHWLLGPCNLAAALGLQTKRWEAIVKYCHSHRHTATRAKSFIIDLAVCSSKPSKHFLLLPCHAWLPAGKLFWIRKGRKWARWRIIDRLSSTHIEKNPHWNRTSKTILVFHQTFLSWLI